MSGIVQVKMLGRFGNQSMQYLFARAYAERIGAEFACEPWVGEEVFQISQAVRYAGPALPERDCTQVNGESDVCIKSYCQNQSAMIYTVRQARDWLRFRHSLPEVFTTGFAKTVLRDDRPICHLRRGDYAGYGYVVVSRESYFAAKTYWNLLDDLAFLSEENPTPRAPGLPEHLNFMPDFMRMVYAPILLRANSTFSWLAALLNVGGRIFAPRISGLCGGREHTCEFVQGNWPKLANLDGCTDLHVLP